ncbi:hypothetical protein FAGKG844_20131 [Frankia sp. AgKG'84/4]
MAAGAASGALLAATLFAAGAGTRGDLRNLIDGVERAPNDDAKAASTGQHPIPRISTVKQWTRSISG